MGTAESASSTTTTTSSSSDTDEESDIQAGDAVCLFLCLWKTIYEV